MYIINYLIHFWALVHIHPIMMGGGEYVHWCSPPSLPVLLYHYLTGQLHAVFHIQNNRYISLWKQMEWKSNSTSAPVSPTYCGLRRGKQSCHICLFSLQATHLWKENKSRSVNFSVLFTWSEVALQWHIHRGTDDATFYSVVQMMSKYLFCLIQFDSTVFSTTQFASISQTFQRLTSRWRT